MVDTGLKRPAAIGLVVALVYLLGIPSARNLNILSNQDFVWSGALMISGAFIAIAVIRQGIKGLTQDINSMENDWSVGKYWTTTIRFFIPVAATFLLFWWLFASFFEGEAGEWYNPLNPFSLMTCLVQWFLVIAIFIAFNRKIAGKTIG